MGPGRHEGGDDRLDRTLAFGPLSEALRLSRLAQGLSLENVVARLADAGISVSRSTLSAWERGIHRPVGVLSRDALRVLETLYGHSEGSLVRLAGPATPRRERTGDRPVDPEAQVHLDRLTDAVHQVPYSTLDVHEVVTVAADGSRTHWIRHLVQAEAPGLDRHVHLVPGSDGRITAVRELFNCEVGKRDAPAEGFETIELLLGRSLDPGDSQMFELEVDVEANAPRRFRRLVRVRTLSAVLELRFLGATPDRIERAVWRLGTSEPVDVEELVPDPTGTVVTFERRPEIGTLVGMRWS